MPKRLNKVATIVEKKLSENACYSIGHPCGFIAPGPWLARRPKASRAVADFLVNDATFSGDF